ncbi:hypothetical protein DSO57_1018532 [Entomophthora muscae]|uniref:Uncharacterized protein n=1 Tax=Entomophthora muscae TaxID=34485 RepID=A0ACC2U3P3_9FUNG|nr:hypothetical protein DSO57_1018532 [Entomophthora muscae]
MTNCEIEALRAREGKSVEIMARWRDDNKVLPKKINSLEAKLLKALSQEGQDNGRMDWLGLDLSQSLYQLHIKYKPGKKLVTAVTLSRLYVASITGDNGLDPEWPMLYLLLKNLIQRPQFCDYFQAKGQ